MVNYILSVVQTVLLLLDPHTLTLLDGIHRQIASHKYDAVCGHTVLHMFTTRKNRSLVVSLNYDLPTVRAARYISRNVAVDAHKPSTSCV